MATRRKKHVSTDRTFTEDELHAILREVEFKVQALLESQFHTVMMALGYRRADDTREGARIQ